MYLSVSTKFRHENINGISLSVFKSAIQKFLRRDERYMGLGTLKIMENFDMDTKESDKIISNIINRMIVMMSEEIGINNAMLPVLMKTLYENFLETKDYEIVYEMYNSLCNSEKCRLLSDIKTTFNLMPYPSDDLNDLELKHIKLISENKEIVKMYDYIYDSDVTLLKIKKSLLSESKKYDSFIYLSHYLRENYHLKNGFSKLWKIVIGVSCEKTLPIIQALKYFYTKMTHKEKFLYFYQAMHTIIHKDELSYEPLKYSKPLKECFVYTLLDIKFPDYVYDIHTGNNKKNTVDFALEGAYVKNECVKFKNDEWRKNYIKFKKMLENEDSLPNILSTELFKDCIRGQRLTSSSKPYVYIPIGNEYEGYVYKGPYIKKSKRPIIMSSRIEMLKFMNTTNVLIADKIEQSGDVWFKYKCIGDYKNITYTTAFDNVSKSEIKLLNRESFGTIQLQDFDEDYIYGVLFGKHMLILSLLDLSLLRVGDTGLYNILMSEGNPYIIDIEDTSGRPVNGKEIYRNVFCKHDRFDILMKGFFKKKTEIGEHLEKLKLLCPDLKNKYPDYWDFIKSDPIDNINLLIDSLNNL